MSTAFAAVPSTPSSAPSLAAVPQAVPLPDPILVPISLSDTGGIVVNDGQPIQVVGDYDGHIQWTLDDKASVLYRFHPGVSFTSNPPDNLIWPPESAKSITAPWKNTLRTNDPAVPFRYALVLFRMDDRTIKIVDPTVENDPPPPQP